MSIASMLIPSTVKAELSPEYPESDCQQQASQQSSQEGQSQQHNQDLDIATDCSDFRPKSPRKSVSEGFSTSPVNISSSGLPSAFKSPQSIQSSVSPSNNTADDLSCRGYYGSPDTPEVDDLEIDTTKSKVTLWQFLLQLLMDPRYSEIIRWTNNAGEFVLLKAEEVARLWGLRKDNNHRMNYDKLSRALRYYYQKDIIRKVQGHKFVYQFIGLQGLCNPTRQMSVENSLTDSDHAKHQRRQSATNKPALGMEPESAFSGYSAFRKQTESFMALQQQHSINHNVSRSSRSAFERTFPANLNQSFDYSVSSAPSNISSSFHPALSSPACDFSKLYSHLPKNHDPLHLSRHTDENMSEAMDLHSCKGSPLDFLPHSRQARRSCSPDCNCSCHNSVLSHKIGENRAVNFSSWGNQGFRRPQSMDCWPPSGTLENHSIAQLGAFDQRSALHLQRHMINMNRFTEEIKRFSTWGANEERKVQHPPTPHSDLSTSNNTPGDTIFRPFDVPKSGFEAMETDTNISRESSQCPSSSSESQNSASGTSGNGNYVWMPIQVDLIEHFMSMISQTIQDTKPLKEPPAAHSSNS
ncbi:unnamed protein product [Rodentolepis nana]|uniref:ETS domain-containing protein n=1 Tax=Rodentolepis nana TaxID=102285 RepID=A0A0R3TXL1_RODNA|nr:unnamed protein product [Rodentolepis nana]